LARKFASSSQFRNSPLREGRKATIVTAATRTGRIHPRPAGLGEEGGWGRSVESFEIASF